MDEIVELHRRASDGLLSVARAAAGRWERPSPCTEWDARGVVEHVIGFHEMLVLKPLKQRCGLISLCGFASSELKITGS